MYVKWPNSVIETAANLNFFLLGTAGLFMFYFFIILWYLNSFNLFSLLFIKNIFNNQTLTLFFFIIGSKLIIALSFYKLSKAILFDCLKIYWYFFPYLTFTCSIVASVQCNFRVCFLTAIPFLHLMKKLSYLWTIRKIVQIKTCKVECIVNL